MRWEDERYVRFYARDTPEWLALSWQARGLFGLVLRAVDRAGVLTVGKLGKKGVAVAVRAPWVEIDAPLAELLGDGCVVWDEARSAFLIRNYLEAQECAQSDAARKRASRERARAQFGGGSDASEKARAAVSQSVTDKTTAKLPVSQSVTDGAAAAVSQSVTNTAASQDVTVGGHETGHVGVTIGHTASQAVTPCCAVPYRAVPNKEKVHAQSAEKQPPAPPSAFVLYVTGQWLDLADPADFETRAREAFPGIDPLAEARKARGWELADARHRKRKHGLFLWGWLTTAQERASKNGVGNGRAQLAAPNLFVDNDAHHAEPSGRKLL